MFFYVDAMERALLGQQERVVMNEPTTTDSSTSKHTDMASVMQGKGADTAWTQECRHSMDTGMQTQ